MNPTQIQNLLKATDEGVKNALSAQPKPTKPPSLDEFTATVDSLSEVVFGAMNKRAQSVDSLIRHLYRKHFAKLTDNIEILALGGYGNGLLFPNSDIDLCVFHHRSLSDKAEKALKAFVSEAWTYSFEWSCRPYTLTLLKKYIASDITLYTSFLTARHICGKRLYDSKTKNRIRALRSPKQFYKIREELMLKRREELSQSAFQIEPDIKNAPGGLRDCDMTNWLSLVIQQKLHTLHEEQKLILCKQRLSTLRYLCSLLESNTVGNKLGLTEQRLLSKLFFGKTGTSWMTVMMRFYFQVSQEVSSLLYCSRRAIYKHLYPNKHSSAEPQGHKNKGFSPPTESAGSAMQQAIKLVESNRVEKEKEMDIESLRQLHELGTYVKRWQDSDEETRQAFMQLMSDLSHSPQRLQKLRYSRALENYLPEFKQVVGQMQFDLYHSYTVDAHTLKLMEQLSQIHKGEGVANAFPWLKDIQIPPNFVLPLSLGALFHDLGKGRGGDHSHIGAELVRDLCMGHGLTKEATNTAAWLVEKHLLMSEIAQKRDLLDPDVLQEFVSEVKNVPRLNMLLFLTIADIRATNPSLWNGWRAELLRRLYTHTLSHLDDPRGWGTTPPKESGVPNESMRQIEELYGPDCLHDWPQGDRSRIAATLFNNNREQWGVYISPATQTYKAEPGSYTILIHLPNSTGLFAQMVDALSRSNLQMIAANVRSSAREGVLDSFSVVDLATKRIRGSASRLADLRTSIQRSLETPLSKKAPTQVIAQSLRRVVIPSLICISVAISEHLPEKMLQIEIKSKRHPGVISALARTFIAAELSLYSARIIYQGARMERLFLLSDNSDPDSNDNLLHNVDKCQELLVAIDRDVHLDVADATSSK